MGGVVFHGTKGTMPAGRSGYEVFPDRKVNPVNSMAAMLGGHPVGGPQAVPDQPELWTEKVKDTSGNGMTDYQLHHRNFLDCMRSRKDPIGDIESGHRVATVCHLANISMRTGRKITWDADKEQIVGDPEANARLVRPYRKPWDAELRALGVG
jgi:hypothetical protein